MAEVNGAQLLEPAELAEQGPPEAVRLPLDLIDDHPSNPRQVLTEINELAASIANPEIGLLQPIVVRRVGERYEVLGGHRRLAAFRRLREEQPYEPQWRAIPAVVRTMADDQAYVALLTAQMQIAAWRPREQSMALERMALSGLTLAEIGKKLSRTEGWVSKRLRVFADTVLAPYVLTGKLAPSIAEELLAVRDGDTKRRLAERASAESWSQDQLKGQVRALRLDRQLAELGKRAREMVELLSSIKPGDIPLATTRDLWVVAGRIQSMARGPQIPTIEQAEKVARITPRKKARAEAARRKNRRRTMPAPA
jgi:ParB family transcriptional regulator, chromosome partitioning protein